MMTFFTPWFSNFVVLQVALKGTFPFNLYKCANIILNDHKVVFLHVRASAVEKQLDAELAAHNKEKEEISSALLYEE